MKRLIAVFPILFESTNFEPGDELPTHNAGFVEIWTGNGAAVWRDTEEQQKRGSKARQMTATTGFPGDACPSSGTGQDLVGKPPSRKSRGAQPEPAKGRRKSSA